MGGYRENARGIRTLDLKVPYTRGSLTLGTVACILMALALAWYPTINRGRFGFECERVQPGTTRAYCTLHRETWGIHRTEEVVLDTEHTEAFVQSDGAIPEECGGCSRAVIRYGYDRNIALGRYPAALEDAYDVAFDLNDFFTYRDRRTVHVAYGPPSFPWRSSGPWLGVAIVLAASLVVRRFHRVVLRWDPQERYLTLERRRWPLRSVVQHVPNDTLIGAKSDGHELLETHLCFASGRMLSLFGATVANSSVHADARRAIENFVREERAK